MEQARVPQRPATETTVPSAVPCEPNAVRVANLTRSTPSRMQAVELASSSGNAHSDSMTRTVLQSDVPDVCHEGALACKTRMHPRIVQELRVSSESKERPPSSARHAKAETLETLSTHIECVLTRLGPRYRQEKQPNLEPSNNRLRRNRRVLRPGTRTPLKTCCFRLQSLRDTQPTTRYQASSRRHGEEATVTGFSRTVSTSTPTKVNPTSVHANICWNIAQ